MDSLARSPAPRPQVVDPAALLRRAPLLARLAEVRAHEARALLLALGLEIAVGAAALLIVRVSLPALPLGHLRGALGQIGSSGWGLTGVVVIAAALHLAWWTSGATRWR